MWNKTVAMAIFISATEECIGEKKQKAQCHIGTDKRNEVGMKKKCREDRSCVTTDKRWEGGWI